MRRSNVRRAVCIWIAALAVGALALLSALRWAPGLAPIAGGFLLLAAMLGLAALDFILLRDDGPDESGLAPVEPSAALEDELKRKDRGSLPQTPVAETCPKKAPSAAPSAQRNA